VQRLCKTQEVQDKCPETCGLCTDECYDDEEAEFQIDNRIGDKSCKWVASSANNRDKYCTPDHVAFFYCKETCENCDGTLETFPSAAPSAAFVDDGICQDSSTEKFLYGSSELTCAWLSKAAEIHRKRLCVPAEEAYWLCEATCGKCKDECDDDEEFRFRFGNSNFRTCSWLAQRPTFRQAQICEQVADVKENCPQTCRDDC